MVSLSYYRNEANKTNTKLFCYVCSLFEGSILSSKNYNISLELVKKNAFFEKNKINFGNDLKFFVFVYNKNLRQLFSSRSNLLRAELTHGLGVWDCLTSAR